MTTARILVLSPDLMITSRLAAEGPACHATIATLRSPDAPLDEGPFDLVLLDLQSLSGDAAELVAKARDLIARLPVADGDGTKLIAFGPHVAKQRLDDAKAAGADAVVSRGELLGSFPAIIRRWCPPA